jgi:hypothetical protein
LFVVEQDDDFVAPPYLQAFTAAGESLWIEKRSGRRALAIPTAVS